MSRVPSVVLSYGLGTDSTAILLRWLLEPESRTFDLADLVVVTAMTGDEWEQTGRDVEQHVLPLLRKHGVRYVQVARAGRSVATDGIVTLDDSTSPTRVFLNGGYRLSDEMRENGTVPQSGGARLCSVHAKGDALDPTIEWLTEGKPYRHVIGFEANEPKRAEKDRGYNTDLRTGEYPLIEWGWDREACERYIASVTGGVLWEKSACVYCPFALANKEGRARVLARYTDQPQAGVDTLMMEHVSVALNPLQALLPRGESAYGMVKKAGHQEVLDGFHAALDAAPAALYEVRRILRPRRDDPTKMANAARSIRRIAEGARTAMLADLSALAQAEGVGVVIQDHASRAWLLRRGDTFPAREHYYVVAPAVVSDKEHDRFDQWWDEHVDPAPLVRDEQQLVLA